MNWKWWLDLAALSGAIMAALMVWDGIKWLWRYYRRYYR